MNMDVQETDITNRKVKYRHSRKQKNEDTKECEEYKYRPVMERRIGILIVRIFNSVLC